LAARKSSEKGAAEGHLIAEMGQQKWNSVQNVT